MEAFAGDGSVLVGGSTMEAYWDEEHQEIKYEIGDGSSIDQLLVEWHASLYGLGEIFDPAEVRSANAAIYRHNFIPVMGEVYNPCRIYCLNDEGMAWRFAPGPWARPSRRSPAPIRRRP